LTFTDLTWNIPQTVTVTAVDDAVIEGFHIGVISHTASSNDLDYDGISIASATVSIADNDIDLAVSKSVDNANPDEGATIVYTIQVVNIGSLGATGVTIGDTLPAGLTFTGYQASQGSYTAGTGQWAVGELAATASATLTITATVNAGTGGTTITNSAAFSTADQVDVVAGNNTASAAITVVVPIQFIYLPFITNNFAPAPDLIVESISAAGNNVQVVIKNQGSAAVFDAFWVDVYVDPQPVPTGVNQIWDDGRSAYGLVWGVTSPIAPDGTLTLTIGDAYYWPSLSNLPATLPAGTPLYAQVDSANISTTYGGVRESHEINSGVYNNITGPVLVSSSTDLAGAPVVSPEDQPISKGNLPQR
jgi:uncharacterized repeat protein (TIGR01451 family)